MGSSGRQNAERSQQRLRWNFVGLTEYTLLCGYYNSHFVGRSERDRAISVTMSNSSYQHPYKMHTYFCVEAVYQHT
jgi:hypothetical protein